MSILLAQCLSNSPSAVEHRGRSFSHNDCAPFMEKKLDTNSGLSGVMERLTRRVSNVLVWSPGARLGNVDKVS